MLSIKATVTGIPRGSRLSRGFCAARCVWEKLPTRPGICAGMPGGLSRPYLLELLDLGCARGGGRRSQE